MAKDRVNVAEKGRDLEAEAQLQPGTTPVTTPVSADETHVAEKGRNLPAAEVQQATAAQTTTPVGSQEANTYQADANGAIVAGPGTGMPTGTPLSTEESNKAGLTETEAPATPSVPLNDMTYVSDANGNVVAGKQTGTLPGTNLETQESLITKQNEPEPSTEAVPAYRVSWGKEGYTVDQALKDNPNMSIKEIMDDHRRWANDTGGTFSIFDYVPHMEGKDITKSQAQNEKDAKKLERQEKWERIGNFLGHLGNFVGAAGFGAPSQTLESATALTERQKKMRDAQLAQRNAYNKNYLDQYWKQREENYKNNRLDQYQQALDRQDAELYLKEKQFDEKMSLEDRKLQVLQDYRNGLLSQGAAKIAIQRMNAETARMNAGTSRMREGRMSSGTTTSTTTTKETPLGTQKTTVQKTTKPGTSSSKSKPQKQKVNY